MVNCYKPYKFTAIENWKDFSYYPILCVHAIPTERVYQFNDNCIAGSDRGRCWPEIRVSDCTYVTDYVCKAQAYMFGVIVYSNYP